MNIKNLPLVSIIIPCRNEERFIEKCLDSIVANDYPKDKIEILVVDGMSDDRTREIVEKMVEEYEFVKILDNPNKTTPVALNIGIRKAQGDVVIILSAHSMLSANFVAKNIEYLQKTEASCVGGVMLTIGATSFIGKAISSAISSLFGVGNAMFRIGVKEPVYVDTVPFGAYRKEVFDKIGFFDEELVRNQDDEFNFRLIKNGGKILLIPDIVSYYYARQKLTQIAKQYFQYGYFKVMVIQKVEMIFTLRQLIPSIFVASATLIGFLSLFIKPFVWLFLLVIGSYTMTNLLFSLLIAIKKGLGLFFVLPLVFVTLHFSYGIGFLIGIWDFMVLRKYLKQKINDVALTR